MTFARVVQLLLPLSLLACSPTRPTAATVVGPPTAPLPELPAGVKGVDVYGTARFSGDDVRRALAPGFDRWLATDDAAESKRLQRDLEARLLALGGFHSVHFSPIGYYRPGGMEYYVTVDVVEASSERSRLSFAPPPTGDVAEVDGLVAAWNAYQAKGFQLLRSGAVAATQRPACPAFHCFVGFEHPDLAAYGARFDAEVPPRRGALVRILRESSDEGARGAAAFLLAHLRDGNDVVALLSPALNDASGLVRNNAARVLQDIAARHPEIEVPIEPALAALDHPLTTDRNKALALVGHLATRPEHRQAILARGAILVRLLRLQQPNNHDLAYEILRKLSGQSFAARDYPAWERWLAGAR